MPKLNKNVLKQANCSWNGPQKVAPKFFRHSVLELFYIPMWNILKMWATYSKALLENHMIFHLCVVAFHQFLVSSRECARTSKVVAVAPLLRNNWTKSYAQNLRRSHARRLGVVQLLFLFILKIWKFENHGCFQLELLVFCQFWLHLGLPWNGFDSHSYCDFVVCLDESRQVNISYIYEEIRETLFIFW